MSIVRTRVNRFDGGITNNPRDNQSNKMKGVVNFDILSDPFVLRPYRDTENGDSASATYKPRNFCIGYDGGESLLYYLGTQSGASDAEVRSKDLDTGGGNDLQGGGWNTPTANQQDTGTLGSNNLFVHYRNQNEIYSIALNSGTYYIQSFSTTGSAWTYNAVSLGTGVSKFGQGLVHSEDDIVYVPYDNKIAKKDGSNSWSASALSGLPADYYITCLAEYNQYIAIAMSPTSGYGNSKVYLWDRDSSKVELTELIDFGSGTLKVIETLQGHLVGISVITGNAVYQDRVIFRHYQGSGDAQMSFQLIEDLDVGSTGAELFSVKQKEDDRIYFMMSFPLHGKQRMGVWSYGQSGIGSPWTITHEVPLDDDTDTSGATMHAFYKAGGYFFQSFTLGGTEYVTKTNNSNSAFTASSIYESVINPNLPPEHDMDRKSLHRFYVRYNPLGSTSRVVVEYRVDDRTEAGWVTLIDDNVGDDATRENAVFYATKEDDAGDIPKQGREFEYRITSTGGAEIAEFGADYLILKDNEE